MYVVSRIDLLLVDIEATEVVVPLEIRGEIFLGHCRFDQLDCMEEVVFGYRSDVAEGHHLYVAAGSDWYERCFRAKVSHVCTGVALCHSHNFAETLGRRRCSRKGLNRRVLRLILSRTSCRLLTLSPRFV